MSVSIRSISKRFGRFPALHSIDLDIRDGELVSLLGPSGSGKTTLLRILAGLEIPDAGSVSFGGTDVTDATPSDRGIGLVFQHYALWGHMSVFENIAFGLRVGKRRREVSSAEIQQRVTELIEMVQLTGMERRLPSQLSGGQQQRVGLARALAIKPRVLLLDEPFGALDAKVRKELRDWVRELQKQLGITTIFVTHDQEEAIELSDRIVVMKSGRIEQAGTPAQIYKQPATPFVCEFVGSSNKLPVMVLAGKVMLGERVITTTREVPDGPGILYVRPAEWSISDELESEAFPVDVREILDIGSMFKAKVTEPVTGARLELNFTEACPNSNRLFIRAAASHLFPIEINR